MEMSSPASSDSRSHRRASCALVLFLILAINVPQLRAAFEYEHGSLRAFALGGAVNSFSGTALDLLTNPAIPVGHSVSAEGWLSRLYNLHDFELGAGAVAATHKRITVGIAETQLTGSDYYWENELSGVVAFGLKQNLRLGIRLDRRELEYAFGYGRFSLHALSAGLWWQPRNRVSIGVALASVNSPRFTEAEEPLPLTGRFDIGFTVSERVRVYTTQEFEDELADRLKFGQELQLSNELDLLIGVSTNPTELSGGGGIDFLGFTVEYGYRDNVYLGGTHRVGMTWCY